MCNLVSALPHDGLKHVTSQAHRHALANLSDTPKLKTREDKSSDPETHEVYNEHDGIGAHLCGIRAENTARSGKNLKHDVTLTYV